MPIEELERELGIRDSIKLASNENPLGPSPKALEAIARALPQLHRYPDGSAFYLRRKLAERHGVSPDEILVGNGSNELIEMLVRTFLRPRDEAVMADQAFVVYRMVTQAVAATPRIVPLRDFTHDQLDDLVGAVADQDLLGRHRVPLREAAAQVERRAVRIAMQQRQRARDRLQRSRRSGNRRGSCSSETRTIRPEPSMVAPRSIASSSACRATCW
jgi:histidinol-phosphate aminotransferase